MGKVSQELMMGHNPRVLGGLMTTTLMIEFAVVAIVIIIAIRFFIKRG
jgi:hypothetical protein